MSNGCVLTKKHSSCFSLLWISSSTFLTSTHPEQLLTSSLFCFSDTKLTAKSLVTDVVASASKLYTSPQGRRSLIYLVSPRTRRHFTPAQISLLAETDSIRAQTSKKDNQVRTQEIRKASSEPLLSWISESGADIVRDPGGSLVVGEIMLYAEGGTYLLVLSTYIVFTYHIV